MSVGNAVLGVPSEIPLDRQIFCIFLHHSAKMLRFALGTLRTAFPTDTIQQYDKLQFAAKRTGLAVGPFFYRRKGKLVSVMKLLRLYITSTLLTPSVWHRSLMGSL